MIVRGITNYSTVGYKGDDLSSILVELLKSANGDIEKAQRGIVCFDEIDKLGDTELEMRKGIAQELLSWMNGTKILIESEKGKSVSFDTSKLTIIGLGAFSKMRKEKKKNNPIGFLVEGNNEEYTTEDFVKIAGMQRELMGRFNCIASLKDLDVNDLKIILTDSELSPLKSFIELASLYGVEVKYDEEFLDEIAEKAYEERIGARALQRQINEIRNKHLIDIISKDIECIDLRKSKHIRTLEM